MHRRRATTTREFRRTIFCRNSARCHAQPSPPRAYERGKKRACGPVAGNKANARSLQSRNEAQGLRRAALAVEVDSVALAEHRRGPGRLRHRRPAVRRQHSRGGEERDNRRRRTQTGTCQTGTAPGLATRLSGFVVSVSLLSPAMAAAQEWPTYGGDPGGRRFSNATQITRTMWPVSCPPGLSTPASGLAPARTA